MRGTRGRRTGRWRGKRCRLGMERILRKREAARAARAAKKRLERFHRVWPVEGVVRLWWLLWWRSSSRWWSKAERWWTVARS